MGRIDTKGGDEASMGKGDGSFMLMDNELGEVLHVNTKDKQVFENPFGKGKFREISAQNESMIASMPPEMRRKFEEAMGKHDTYSAKKTGAGAKVGGWSCDNYEIFKNGKKHEESCVTTDYAQFGLSADEISALKRSLTFAAEDKGAEDKGSQEIEKLIGTKPFALRSTNYSDTGEFSHSSLVKAFKSVSSDPSRFRVPAGYTRAAMPAMPFLPGMPQPKGR